MPDKSAKRSNRLHKVILLLGVYALHIFLFLGLTAFSHPTYITVSKADTHSNNSGNHRDPASVECRSLFKYDDSKQQIQVAHHPAVTQLHTPLYLHPSIVTAGITASLPINLSDEAIKRYRLLGVFLI